MPTYHSICHIPAWRRKWEPHLEELLDFEFSHPPLVTDAVQHGYVLKPHTEALINAVIESAKSKMIREFRNLYPVNWEISGITKDGLKWMKGEYKKLTAPYSNTNPDKELEELVAEQREEIWSKKNIMDRSPQRMAFNRKAIELIYDQVPERIATILSVEDPIGRSKHLEETGIANLSADFSLISGNKSLFWASQK